MKPTIFISSTIKDFKDLRSSIKWWLEENGYKVNASEYNDFDKPLDTNSYESCLKAIDNSDYFILLLGDRFGGMYDDVISITQMEYRHAYKRMLEGKIKLINFARTETAIKIDEYKNSIKGVNIDIEKLEKEERVKYQILNFLQEVRRVKDWKEGKRPKNNWVHQFSSFSEILDAIKGELGDKVGLGYKTKRYIICQDLIKNIKTLMRDDKDHGILPKGFVSKKLFGEFKIDFDNPIVELSRPQQINLGICYISFWQMNKLNVTRIENFYNDGFFLEYDTDSDDYVSNDFNKLVSSLLSYYNSINRLHSSLYDKPEEIIIKLNKKEGETAKINAAVIMNMIKFCETVDNCISYSKSLYKILNHQEYTIPVHIENLNHYPEGSLADSSEIPNEERIIDLLIK